MPSDFQAQPLPGFSLDEALQYLCLEIGPRPSTSRAERRAGEWAANLLRAWGLAVNLEPFKSVPTFSWAFGLFFAMFVAAALLALVPALPSMRFSTSAWVWPWLGLLLALAAAVLFALEASTVETLTRILPRFPSQNVVGCLSSSGARRQRLVLTAHLDSTRSGLLWDPRIVAHFRSLLLIAVGCMGGEIMFLILAAVSGQRLFVWFALLPTAYLAALLFIFVQRETSYSYVQGANDNASGVVAALAVARVLADKPLRETEVWIALTGCEEAGTVGMLRLLDSHGAEWDKATTLFLNFDNVGKGTVSFTTAEGILKPLLCDPDLVRLAAEVAWARPTLAIKPIVYQALTTDNTVALAKGWRGMSILATDNRGILPNWHWETDTYYRVDLPTVETAAHLGLRLARQLDRPALRVTEGLF